MPPVRTDEKHATLKDVARLAGTSVATVSYVLSGDKTRYVTDALRERVQQAADALNYIKSGAASSLRGKKTGILAVLSPQFENHFFATIFEAIEAIAGRNGYVLATLNTFDNPQLEKEALERLIRIRADGYLIIPTIGGEKNTRYLREHQLPFVSIERQIVGATDYDFVTCDSQDAVYQLTKDMLVKGHRRVALVYWDAEIPGSIKSLSSRYDGYVQAMREHGIALDESLVYGGDITQARGAELTERALADPGVTAIVYAHYILAEGGIKWLRGQNKHVPRDVSISFMGAPRWIDMSETDYTHVAQPGVEIGVEAAKILFERIEGKRSSPIRRVIPCAMHQGKSVSTHRVHEAGGNTK